jgi:hypothetical protein
MPGIEDAAIRNWLSWITMIAPLMPGILIAMLKKFKFEEYAEFFASLTTMLRHEIYK